MRLVTRLHAGGALAFYVDLHAHANRRGCFLYGNALPTEEQRVEAAMYARLVAANSRHLDLDGCDFSARNMARRDRRDGRVAAGKEGSGRVGVYTATAITHAYTLECNYNTGRMVNRLQPLPTGTPAGRAAAAASPKRAPPRARPPRYDPACYAEVGRALAVAALDLLGANPASRVQSCERLRSVSASWVRLRERKELARAAKVAAAKPASSDDDEEDDDAQRACGGGVADVAAVRAHTDASAAATTSTLKALSLGRATADAPASAISGVR